MEHFANLQRVFDRATDHDIEVAKESYPKYQRITAEVARKYGFKARVGAAVFAALSPNNDYWGNLRDLDKLLAAAAAGKDLDDFTVSTYGNNKRKAWDIAQGGDPEELIVALKTRNFFHNIDDPESPDWVCIDGHMFNVYHGVRRPIQSKNNANRVVKVTKLDYFAISATVRTFADNHGLIPCQMQGVLWITWRRIHGIHSPKQQELWDRDYREAGLGFVK